MIEILSENYEAKDLVIGVPFYQQIGVKDIVVLDHAYGGSAALATGDCAAGLCVAGDVDVFVWMFGGGVRPLLETI